MKWYVKCMQNYAVFSGRARREEYWMFVVFNIIFSMAAVVVDVIMMSIGIPFLLFSSLYALALFIPSLAVSVRRLHDTGKSGWLWLLAIVPIGNIVLLVLLATEGTRGANCYGGDPKGGMTFTDFGGDGFGGFGGNDLIL